MKRLLFLLLFLPLVLFGQADFPEGAYLGGTANSVTADKVIVKESDGLLNTKPLTDFATSSRSVSINGDTQTLTGNLIYRTAQADTGVLTFGGLGTNSATTINIGSVVGVVVDNEANPLIPTYTLVNYAGATGVTVTTVGSGQASYVMLSSAGVISFQTTFPTSAERKARIWLGKVSHPAGSITLAINEPDYITSPMAYSRDLLQALGGFINGGVYPVENGVNLNMNITGGYIMGDGINFVTSRTSPNMLAMGPNTPATFSERTRTGGVTAGVTSFSVGFYDADGDTTPDAIPGSSNVAALHYIYAIPGVGYIAQYGQATYSTLALAIAAIGKEPFVKWSNLDNNAILIGVLAAQKGATSLRTQDGQGQFFQANVLGGLIGSTAGVSTATFQNVYNNSATPQVTVTDALGAMTWQNGRASNASTVEEWKNIAGATTASIAGSGAITAGDATFTGSSAVNTSRLFTLSNSTPSPKFEVSGANHIDFFRDANTNLTAQDGIFIHGGTTSVGAASNNRGLITFMNWSSTVHSGIQAATVTSANVRAGIYFLNGQQVRLSANATNVGLTSTMYLSSSPSDTNTTMVSIGTETAANSSKFNLVSTTLGSSPFPRQTSAQRSAISSPITGLYSYQTDGIEGLWVNKSTGWKPVSRLDGYTVATLPAAAAVGDTAYVTDALAPTYLATIVGGGAIITPVFYNGTNWVSH